MKQELVPNLFKSEFGKITSVLVRQFGIDHIELAEDIVSETFLLALESWPYRGVPENPTAWLYTVAKNKTKNYLHRDQILSKKITPQLKINSAVQFEPDLDLSNRNISDSQLQMLFALCHPSIPPEAQIGLALRILCGFGIEEIANAFLTNKEAINKRLVRARERLRLEKVVIEVPSSNEIDQRLDTVLTTLYLLFNEGYYSESQDTLVREDLCLEAIRLTNMLVDNERTNLPKVNALLSLMYFHSSRLAARKDQSGDVILYEDQDESLWDQNMIAKGMLHLKQASQGNQLSRYHLEASIAYWHTVKTESKEKWENILQLYNHLLQLEYSPIAALNRTFALAKANGKPEGIAEAEKLQLTTNQYYFTLLGELYKDIDNERAKDNFAKAITLAHTKADKQTIAKKLKELGQAHH